MSEPQSCREGDELERSPQISRLREIPLAVKKSEPDRAKSSAFIDLSLSSRFISAFDLARSGRNPQRPA